MGDVYNIGLFTTSMDWTIACMVFTFRMLGNLPSKFLFFRGCVAAASESAGGLPGGPLDLARSACGRAGGSSLSESDSE